MRISDCSSDVCSSDLKWSTPLEETAHDRRSKMGQLLRAERDEFMRRLHDKRMKRLALESNAATRIQCHFRGHRVRANEVVIRERCQVRKRVRAGLQEQLISEESRVGKECVRTGKSRWS